MCNINKIKSTFLHKGSKYRAFFLEEDKKIQTVVEKEFFSIMGIHLWKKIEVCKGEKYQKVDIANIKRESALSAVKKLREIAMISISPCII